MRYNIIVWGKEVVICDTWRDNHDAAHQCLDEQMEAPEAMRGIILDYKHEDVIFQNGVFACLISEDTKGS